VVLALDVSNSMLATDVAPSRLLRAKNLLLKLVDHLPDDRIGLVLFAGHAYIQMPLTTDHNAARLFIATASPAVITAQGTAIGEALQKAAWPLAKASGLKPWCCCPMAKRTMKPHWSSAKELASKGIMVNTVGIGRPEGGSIIDTVTQAARRDASGNVIISRLNEALLQQIATTTNGIYRNFKTPTKQWPRSLHSFAGRKKSIGRYLAFYLPDVLCGWLPMLLLLTLELFFPDRKKVNRENKPSFYACVAKRTFSKAQSVEKRCTKATTYYRQQQFALAEAQYKEALEKRMPATPKRNTTWPMRCTSKSGTARRMRF
jgi:Ca-activated chloride channel family protein